MRIIWIEFIHYQPLDLKRTKQTEKMFDSNYNNLMF